MLSGERCVKASTTLRQERGELCHTLVLTASGTLFGFGSSEEGELASVVGTVLWPKIIKGGGLTNITDICAVEGGTYVVCGGDTLWSFGFGSDIPCKVGDAFDATSKMSRIFSFCARPWRGEYFAPHHK